MLSTLADAFLAWLLNLPLPYNSTKKTKKKSELVEFWMFHLPLEIPLLAWPLRSDLMKFIKFQICCISGTG